MTSLIDNNIDELIRRVRQYGAASELVFAAAYPPRETPNPVGKYMVAVNNTGVRKAQVFIGDTVGTGRRGRLYEASVTLRIYAPRNSGASALLRVSSLLYDALEACDDDGAIAEISLGEVAYENSLRTVYRDLRLKLQWLLSGEGAA
jgi:hypothetical protein